MFRPAPAQPDLVALEQSELARWNEQRIFERSVQARRQGPPWIFYEGPPTANGRPGLHHVWARVFKDLFCRYRTMRGYLVERRAGWDTHGLPVEVEVEKSLGISGKREIEEIGIGEFVRRCRESVKAYVEDWQALTERIGYWVDLDHAYWTFDPDYVQSVWWHLRQLFDQGLLYEDLKVVPYCPRCGTALSSHELGQPEVYRDEEDESAYVRMPLEPDERLHRILGSPRALVAWTTTPWTLVSNTGLAVNPGITYAVLGQGGSLGGEPGDVVAEDLVEEVFGEGGIVAARLAGSELAGLRYRRPFDDLQAPPGADGWRVVAADFVTTEEGTGVVHLAPAFGEIDRVVGRRAGLPALNPVGPDGRFDASVGWLAGRLVRETNHDINDRLQAAGVLVRRHTYRHQYPHCWRCRTPLIYWGKPSWYIATSQRKDELLAQNETIDWHPVHIKEGRFGEWLANNVDWALSRDRYWGTPLPVWRCRSRHLRCVGSLSELSDLAGRDVTGVDPHRPDIDRVTFDCPECGQVMSRVEPVIDAWFDSGSMPAAQVGYPVRPGSKDDFSFPADFITEAIDQTRGWFYSLLAVNTLVHGSTPYRHVMCLGHIVDVDGRKMSKSLGNVIDPWDILTTRGADALRWWMVSQGSPWTPTRVSFAAIDTSLRDTVLTWWSTFSFFTTYASLNDFQPDDPLVPPPAQRPALDRWMLSRLASTVAAVTTALDGYEPLEAASALGDLVDDLSNWYVRRSRRRFYRTDPDAPPRDALSAQATLHRVLVELSRMMAPICPFVADYTWRELTGAGGAGSVHLADWPVAGEEGPVDEGLEAGMAQARRLASLGRAARAEAGMKVRQPLAKALVFLSRGAPDLLTDLVAAELNVDEVEIAHELGEVLRFELVPNFRELGPRLGKAVRDLRPALARLDAGAAAARLEEGASIEVDLPSGPVTLGPGDVELRVQSQPGFAVSRYGGEVVALELELDDDLRRRGWAQDVVRQVQDLRKSTGLDVSDRIRLRFAGLEPLRPLWDHIAREVLAVEVAPLPAAGGGPAGSAAGPEGAPAGTLQGEVTLELDDWTDQGVAPRAVIEQARA